MHTTRIAGKFGSLANRENIAKFKSSLIGASVSEPHTSESNWDFSYMYYFLTTVVPYILNTNAIAVGHMRTVRYLYSLVSLTAS